MSVDDFDHIFHQVRHPLAVITSWVVNLNDLTRDEWVFIRRHVSEILDEDPLIVQCAKYWYYWNLLAEQKAEWRYRIEDIEEVLPEFMKRSGLVLDKDEFKNVPKNFNSWKQINTRVTWDELKSSLSPELFHNIQDMSYRYGYISEVDE